MQSSCMRAADSTLQLASETTTCCGLVLYNSKMPQSLEGLLRYPSALSDHLSVWLNFFSCSLGTIFLQEFKYRNRYESSSSVKLICSNIKCPHISLIFLLASKINNLGFGEMTYKVPAMQAWGQEVQISKCSLKRPGTAGASVNLVGRESSQTDF